jgi:rifampicin phosphotransferase
MTTLVDLADVDGSMLGVAGGKAVNLGIMSRAGLPVPPGFCVTTHAYRMVVADRLSDLLDKLAIAGDADVRAGLADEARSRVLNAPVPNDLATAIGTHYRRLGLGEAVAVRSSATAEDLPQASFAGQQDTYLNVVGDQDLLQAIRRCWASLWTDRAVSYRTHNGIDHRTVFLAVVVQRMIDAQAAGVMFTANPVTGSRAETVIDASSGLGEAIVSGAVNPDHFVVDTARRTIVERRLGDKRIRVKARSGGGTETEERDDLSAQPCLTDDQILELADLGQRVSDVYTSPQDTEWALDEEGRLWLTQARPITTLFPAPGSDTGEPRVFLCMTLAQGLTRPITPMGLAAFRMIGSNIAAALGRPPANPLAGPPPMAIAGQRVFLDITPVLRYAVSRKLILGAFGAMEARSSAVLKALADDPRFPIVGRFPWRALAPVARLAIGRAKVPLRLAAALINPVLAPRLIARTERKLRIAMSLPADATPAERLNHVEQQLAGGLFLTMPTVFSYPAGGLLMLRLARKALGDLARPGDLQTVLRGLPNNVTTEMDLELWRITERIRDDADSAKAFSQGTTAALTARYRNRTLPPVAQQELTGFLRRYGHRAVAEIDLGMPRWADDPSHIVGVISNYLRLDDPDHAPGVQFQQGEVAAATMITELVERAWQRSHAKARFVGFALERARRLVGFRESPKSLLIFTLGALREQLVRVGEALAQQGRIEVADDIFFLDIPEVRRALAGEAMHDLVAQRREAYDVELRRRHIPRLLLSDGTELEAVAAAVLPRHGAMSGTPASPGTVTAPARVVLDPVGAHLEPGEILVAPSTDPGWTPLFLTAGGLVMEMGGSNSHGAVVAREYGIPAVVGVADATMKIETGQRVTVDGAAGLVSVAPATA